MRFGNVNILSNLNNILDKIIVNLKNDVKDKSVYEFIVSQLKNININNFYLNDQGIVIEEKSDTGVIKSFSLSFLPSLDNYEKIYAKLEDESFVIDSTIEFQSDLVIINESSINKKYRMNKKNEKRVYSNGVLVYSILEKKNNNENLIDYSYEVSENFIDDNTLKSRSISLDCIDGKLSLDNLFYGKKKLENNILFDNRKEKSFYTTLAMISNIRECSENEFNKFLEYWKEINSRVNVEDRKLAKVSI